MQLSEVRQIAKERGLKNISKLKKDELIELLKSTENMTEEVEDNIELSEDKEEFVSRKSVHIR